MNINEIKLCGFCEKPFELMKISCTDCLQIGCNDCVKPIANARCFPCWKKWKSVK